MFWGQAPRELLRSPMVVVAIVEDLHPSTGELRRTVRCELNSEDQQSLKVWVEQFCSLNNLKRDDVECRRVFHISIANLTGLAGDSVR